MSLHNEQGYLALMREILAHGNDRMDRTGTGARSLFGRQITYDLEGGQLPLLTTKKVHIASIIKELLWFLRGETNIKTLGCGIWDQWADENGDLGPIYGKQWRSWVKPEKAFLDEDGKWVYDLTSIDQIANVIKSLRDDPTGRRHIVSAWNPADLPDMALSPCHCLFQFFVRELSVPQRAELLVQMRGVELLEGGPEWAAKVLDDYEIPKYALDCQLYQRSADFFIGVPFNVASYSILTMMIAEVLGYAPGKFIHTMGDVHIYHNHFDAVKTQLDREPLIKAFPKIHVAPRADIDSFELSDFSVIGYDPAPFIPAPVAK